TAEVRIDPHGGMDAQFEVRRRRFGDRRRPDREDGQQILQVLLRPAQPVQLDDPGQEVAPLPGLEVVTEREGRPVGEPRKEVIPRLQRVEEGRQTGDELLDRKSTRLNSSHGSISYAVFCLKKKKQ